MQLYIYIYKDPEFPIDSEISRTTWGMGQHYRCRKPLCFATFKDYFWGIHYQSQDSGQELKQRLVAEIERLEPLLALIVDGGCPRCKFGRSTMDLEKKKAHGSF